MADLEYSKRMGDRREGRLLRSLSGYQRMAPLALRRRSEAVYSIADSVEVSAMEQWLRAKRAEGWAGLGFVHLLIAAYVRTVSMRPAVNRFISGRRIYARNDIQAVLSVKRSASSSAAETCVKVSFSPTDTVFDVYRRLSEAVDAVKAILKRDVRTIYNTHMHKLAKELDTEINSGSGEGKAVSLTAETRDGKNSFRVRIAPPEGKSFAREIAVKYGVTYELLTEKK